ncbi:aa3-type cytochrome oxidase subunit IV [Streptomyces sp. NPDC002004]
MRTEALLFAGVAVFFLVTDVFYAWFAQEPVGIVAFAVSFAMSSLISFFFARNLLLRGSRPEDRKDGEIRERAGFLDFFPPRSAYPPLIALGAALAAIGIVYGLWLFVPALLLLLAGVVGMVMEFARRGD